MTEHVHEWVVLVTTFQNDVGALCRVLGCSAELKQAQIERRINATERLNWQRADAIIGALKGEYEIDDADIDATQAYANTLERE